MLGVVPSHERRPLLPLAAHVHEVHVVVNLPVLHLRARPILQFAPGVERRGLADDVPRQPHLVHGAEACPLPFGKGHAPVTLVHRVDDYCRQRVRHLVLQPVGQRGAAHAVGQPDGVMLQLWENLQPVLGYRLRRGVKVLVVGQLGVGVVIPRNNKPCRSRAALPYCLLAGAVGGHGPCLHVFREHKPQRHLCVAVAAVGHGNLVEGIGQAHVVVVFVVERREGRHRGLYAVDASEVDAVGRPQRVVVGTAVGSLGPLEHRCTAVYRHLYACALHRLEVIGVGRGLQHGGKRAVVGVVLYASGPEAAQRRASGAVHLQFVEVVESLAEVRHAVACGQ